MQLRNIRLPNSTSRFFTAFIVSAVLFFLIQRLFFFRPTIVESIGSIVLYPILLMQKKIISPFKFYSQHKKRVVELTYELQKIKKENVRLLAENIQVHSLLWYMYNTEELRVFKERYNQEGKLVHILVKQFSDQEHCFFIDNGSRHGIESDMIAVYKNCLIGRVETVYPYYSKVILITDKRCKVGACCAKTNVHGIHEGLQNTTYTTLRFVSHLNTLQSEDLILSSGEGLVFPYGFGLGRIKKFKIDGLQYTIVVEPLVDLKTLEYCYVMQGR